jgi:LmbE family N-acetylglucosaminyl deacetylase
MLRIRPQTLPRALYRRQRARRVASEESRFHTRLRVDPHAPQLVLSPHWDDAILDCWSLLSSAQAVNVTNVFAGIPAPGRVTLWDSITGASDSAERAGERLAEDAIALARAGRKPFSLPFLDAQYRRGAAPTLDELDRAVSAEIAGASHVHAPAALGAHPDHKLVRRYGRMLRRAGMPVSLYADLPYCVLHGWPDWVEGREPEPNRNVDAFWLSFLEGVPEMPPLRSARVERLDGPSASAKLQAMACYRTQFPALDGGTSQVLSNPAIHRLEVRWELRHEAGGDQPGRQSSSP